MKLPYLAEGATIKLNRATKSNGILIIEVFWVLRLTGASKG